MEIEAWLASADQRRFHSLGRTSVFFTTSYLSSKTDNKSDLSKAVIPLRLPASLFSKERTSHVGIGWPKLASSLLRSRQMAKNNSLRSCLMS